MISSAYRVDFVKITRCSTQETQYIFKNIDDKTKSFSYNM